MKTSQTWTEDIPAIPTATVWLLNELAEYRGKQDKFKHQSPQTLKALREHSIIQSSVSSNRIEGVEIDKKRVGSVVFGKTMLEDRNEEEVRAYQEALSWIHENEANIPITSETVKKLHRLSHPTSWDSGQFKEKDGEIIEKHPEGNTSIRFRPLSAKETPEAIELLCESSRRRLLDRSIPPLAIWAAFNLDFLCIHPFRDGNGRVSRLLLLLFLYHIGFDAGRYISLERIIEQSKERYYATLHQSSAGWHQGQHNPWPYINYLLYTLKELYQEFERRYESAQIPRGGKTAVVLRAIESLPKSFHISELQKHCPNVSIDMIRKVLKDMRQRGDIQCSGRGKNAKWTKP